MVSVVGPHRFLGGLNMLAGQRAVPAALQAAGYRFTDTALEPALREARRRT